MFFVDRFGVLDRELTRRIGPGDGGTATAQFHDRLRSLVQPLSFGNVLFLALVLWLMFRARVPLFVDHLVFSMHTVSFVLVSTLLLAPAFLWEDALGSFARILVLGVGIWQFGYLTTAIRRLHYPPEGGHPKAGARLRAFGIAVLLYMLNGIFVSAVQMFGGWLAIRAL